MPSVEIELERTLSEIEAHAFGSATRFASRTEASDLIEAHVLDRLQSREENGALSDDLARTRSRAEALCARLERGNERFLRRLRHRIATGRYTRAGLTRAFARVSDGSNPRGYGSLDRLLAGLSDTGTPSKERSPLEPEMVAYQPTPARVILELIERAKIGAEEVFYDLGSGLGHVLILVALLTGARVRGIEIERAYCAYARRGARALGLRNVEVVPGDARTASLADGAVYFLYTPFRGAMLQQVLERLREESTRRAIRICTYGPCTADVARAPWLRSRAQLDEHDVAVFESVP